MRFFLGFNDLLGDFFFSSCFAASVALGFESKRRVISFLTESSIKLERRVECFVQASTSASEAATGKCCSRCLVSVEEEEDGVGEDDWRGRPSKALAHSWIAALSPVASIGMTVFLKRCSSQVSFSWAALFFPSLPFLYLMTTCCV